jgi:hypothetical protein
VALDVRAANPRRELLTRLALLRCAHRAVVDSRRRSRRSAEGASRRSRAAAGSLEDEVPYAIVLTRETPVPDAISRLLRKEIDIAGYTNWDPFAYLGIDPSIHRRT